jgi:DNA-binding CsgD family transcriptional regulator
MGTVSDPAPRGDASRIGRAAGRSVPLVGRDDELGRLIDNARRVADGRGRTVVIGGEPGIGKSRLIADVLAFCARRGFTMFSATADEVRRQRPFAVVLDALRVTQAGDAARAEIGRLLDNRPAAENLGPGLESNIADLLVGLVAEQARAGPVVVALDDLQWADESALVAVKALARLADARPVLLLCAHRPYPARRGLLALLASLDYLGADRLELAGIAPAAVRELAAALAGVPPADDVAAMLGHAAGNPFFVASIFGLLLRDDAVAVSSAGLLELTGTWMPPGLRQTLLDELAFLPHDTLEVLRAAAIAGRSFSIAEVSMITPSRVPDLVAAVGAAIQAGVVETVGERLAFRHDLIREAIYEELAPEVRRALHRELAAQLNAAGATIDQIAAHLMLGAQAGDGEAIADLRRAAAEVLASSPATAADLLWRALALAAELPGARMAVLVDLVRPLIWTGQAERAEQVCGEALAGDPPAGEEPLFWMGLVNSRILQGRPSQAREAIARALDCATLTDSDRLHLRAAGAVSGAFLGDPRAISEAREIAATAPRSVPRGVAQETIVQWELLTGHADRSLAAAAEVEAMREPEELGSRIWGRSGIRARIWEAVALLDLDRLDEAAALLEEEILGKLSVLGLPHALKAACHYHAGEYAQAQRDCDAADAASQLGGNFNPASAPAIAATIALRQGRLRDAQRLLERAEAIRMPAEMLGDTIVRWTRALVLEAGGDVDGASEAAGGALLAYGRAGFVSCLAWHAPDIVRVSLAAGNREQAAVAVAAAARAAEQLPVASRRAGALRAAGLLSDDFESLREAVGVARDAPRPLDRAHALRDLAAALARSGEHAAARPPAEEALETLAGLGADGERRSARSMLRDAGLHVGARSKHAAGSGWESLTRTEREIVKLTAEGRSNPEIAQALFIGRRTVRWHLSNVFLKLGVSSRGELTAQALRRDLS